MNAALLLTAVLAGAGPDSGAAVRTETRAYRAANELEILRELEGLLAIPNVASDGPNIQRNAEAVARAFERRGVRTELLRVPGAPPVVYGERAVPGAKRTVIFYAHYDGQPVKAADWNGDPWKPVLRDGPLRDGGKPVAWDTLRAPVPPEWRLYARSASDDKAPIIGLLAALDALKAAGRVPSVNLKFFFEGEEEAGSPHLAEILAGNAERLRGDVWLLLDGPVHQTRRMAVYFGARGVTDLEITVYGPSRPLHSGHYGNWAVNPIAELVALLSSLRDDEGRILVAGFSDDLRPTTPAERRALSEAPRVDDALRQSLQLGRTEGQGASLLDLLMLPALNLHGIAQRRRRTDGDQRDPDGSHGLHRFSPGAGSDAGPRSGAHRGARAPPGIHRRARGPDSRGTSVRAPRRAARVGRGLSGGADAHGPAGLARGPAGRGRSERRSDRGAAHARRKRPHVPLRRHPQNTRRRCADRQPRQRPACRQREPASAKPLGRHRALRRSHDASGRAVGRGGGPLIPPVLRTDRLRLRPFTAADAPAVQVLAGAREIADTTRQIPHPYADGLALAWIATHAELHAEDRALTLAVEVPEGPRLCGAIGLRLAREDRHAELGYWIGVADWGRGFCTEAAQAVLDFGFESLRLHRVYAMYFARNPASGRVLEKLGMAREGLLRGHVRKWGVFEDLVLQGILREEWLDRQKPGAAGSLSR